MGVTREIVENHYGKIATALITSFLLYAIPAGVSSIRSNIVLASDLDAVVKKLGDEVQRQLAPIIKQQEQLARQQQTNSLAICTARKAQLKSAIRNTKVQIDDMQKDKKAKPTIWTQRDQQLLDELEIDLEQSLDEYNGLACRDTTAPE